MAEIIRTTEDGNRRITEDGNVRVTEDSTPSTGVGTMTIANNLTGDGYAKYQYAIKPKQ